MVMHANSRILRNERGAAVLEFALVFPVIAFLLLGLLYGFIAVAANVSLAHAASRGVRYASIPVDAVGGVYPSTADVEARVDDNTPFFAASSCATTVAGESVENAPVTLDVACDFPNPIGSALSGLRNLFGGAGGTSLDAGSLRLSAHAEARRE
jgi:Flp pilus assembly protein TadG